MLQIIKDNPVTLLQFDVRFQKRAIVFDRLLSESKRWNKIYNQPIRTGWKSMLYSVHSCFKVCAVRYREFLFTALVRMKLQLSPFDGSWFYCILCNHITVAKNIYILKLEVLSCDTRLILLNGPLQWRHATDWRF